MSEESRGCSIHIGAPLGAGTIIAVLLSWTTWASVPWAIIHGLLGWLFVIYWALVVWK